jgi:hypothetical protein
MYPASASQTSCDEGLHCNLTCLLHNRLVYPTTPPAHLSTIIFDTDVNVEHEFVRDAIPFLLLSIHQVPLYR